MNETTPVEAEPAPARIYLDHGATSWPKPPQVIEAMQRYYTDIGSAAGRGAGRHAVDADRIIDNARLELANLINAPRPEHVLFFANGTAALNQAILGLLRPGEHVVATEIEHNSVLRPLRYLQDARDVEVTIAEADEAGFVRPEAIRDSIRDTTRLIAINHGSNVTGCIQDLEAIGRLAREHGVRMLVDAAQTVGSVPVDVQAIDCDLLAATGHKALAGPLGTGLLYVRDDLAAELTPLMFGGTGTRSDSDHQPDELPTKFESGNMNTAAIAGLLEGLKFLRSESGRESIRRASAFKSWVWKELYDVEGITLYGPEDEAARVGLLSFTIDGVDSREVAIMLETQWNIESRAGFHCAPLIHRRLKTEASGGTVRLSWGWSTTEQELQLALEAIKEIAAVNIF